MEKRFSVIATSLTMDAEIKCNDYAYDARNYYESFIKSGCYSKVYIVDNETGELYDTFDRSLECGGVKIEIWSKL